MTESLSLIDVGRLAPNYPPQVAAAWKEGCRPRNSVPEGLKLNSLTAGLFEEIWMTSPDALYPCPLRDLKLQVLPLVQSQCRLFFFEELPQLPARLADQLDRWLTPAEENLMVTLIDDWYDWYHLREYDPYYDDQDESEELASTDTPTDVDSLVPTQKEPDISIPTVSSFSTTVNFETTNPTSSILTSASAPALTPASAPENLDDSWTVVNTSKKRQKKGNRRGQIQASDDDDW